MIRAVAMETPDSNGCPYFRSYFTILGPKRVKFLQILGAVLKSREIEIWRKKIERWDADFFFTGTILPSATLHTMRWSDWFPLLDDY
jgi:hypothetical protein